MQLNLRSKISKLPFQSNQNSTGSNIWTWVMMVVQTTTVSSRKVSTRTKYIMVPAHPDVNEATVWHSHRLNSVSHEIFSQVFHWLNEVSLAQPHVPTTASRTRCRCYRRCTRPISLSNTNATIAVPPHHNSDRMWELGRAFLRSLTKGAFKITISILWFWTTQAVTSRISNGNLAIFRVFSRRIPQGRQLLCPP